MWDARTLVRTNIRLRVRNPEFRRHIVSMWPDAILKDRETGEIVGCVKLNFSKSAPFQELAGANVATDLRPIWKRTPKVRGRIDPSRCYVVDVPTGTVCVAPTANKRRLGDLTAAGEEIASRWTSIQVADKPNWCRRWAGQAPIHAMPERLKPACFSILRSMAASYT